MSASRVELNFHFWTAVDFSGHGITVRKSLGTTVPELGPDHVLNSTLQLNSVHVRLIKDETCAWNCSLHIVHDTGWRVQAHGFPSALWFHPLVDPGNSGFMSRSARSAMKAWAQAYDPDNLLQRNPAFCA